MDIWSDDSLQTGWTNSSQWQATKKHSQGLRGLQLSFSHQKVQKTQISHLAKWAVYNLDVNNSVQGTKLGKGSEWTFEGEFIQQIFFEGLQQKGEPKKNPSKREEGSNKGKSRNQ